MKYLVSGKEMKTLEKQAMEKYKIPSLLLMERAANAVVKELYSGSYHLNRILVACGTGNNGGDGLAIARLLMMDGYKVDLCMVGALDRLTLESKQQLEMVQAISGNFVTAPVYGEYTVIVDAIFGIGCNRGIEGIAAEAICGMNDAGVPIVAVDVPSGISADTGKVCDVAVKAETTVTFFTEKLGCILYPGRDYCGKIVVADLGLPLENSEECDIITYTDHNLEQLPKRANNSHKGSFGKVLVIAGNEEIFGAAYFAAAGAYRMGAGLVKVFTPEANRVGLQNLLPEALIEVYDRKRPSVKQLEQCLTWADVIVIGPGFGTDRIADKILKFVIGKSKVPVVIDADGINILGKSKICLLDQHAPIILTPHIQEMARLTGKSRELILKDPIGEAKNFVEDYPVTLVLKDARTIVAKEKEPVYINRSGNSGMATGGSGDVLAGMLGALMAQGMDAVNAARLGVYLHGKAGDAAAAAKSKYSMTATDILDGIAEVTRI